MKILDVANDKVINSSFLCCKTTIKEAKEKMVTLINRFNQQRYTLESKLYNRLREDIKKGCIMPPLTLAFIIKDIDSFKSKSAEEKEEYINTFISNAFVLDGIQRLNNISKIEDISQIENNAIYLNIIISNSIDKLLYRMITLNNGQKPMSTRHQIEMLSSGMYDFDNIDLKIQTEKEQKNSKKEENSFSKENIIKAYLAYITDSINIDNQKIIDGKMDELIGEKIMESSIINRKNDFKDFINLIKRFSENRNFYKWLSNMNNMIGIASTGDKFFILENYDASEIYEKIELSEEAFKAINVSKIKVSNYRRKIARNLILNYEKNRNIDLNNLIDQISQLD